MGDENRLFWPEIEQMEIDNRGASARDSAGGSGCRGEVWNRKREGRVRGIDLGVFVSLYKTLSDFWASVHESILFSAHPPFV